MLVKVEQQPLVAATERIVQSMDFVGSPLSPEDRKALETAYKLPKAADCTEEIQKILDISKN